MGCEVIATSADLKAVLCRILLPVALLLSGQATAQIEEIVVTAEMRETSLQDTPLSITALSADSINAFNATDVTQLDTQLPTLRFMGGEGGNGAINVVIRGVGTYSNQPNVDMAVAWNVDGTYISHQFAIPPILFDVERIELVRGPLGTLYGKNSNGGALNIRTAKPVLGEWQASGELGYGNHDQVDSEFMVNIPLGEDAALRLALASDYSDGYYDDGGSGTDNYAGRARLLFEPSENLEILLSGDFTSREENCCTAVQTTVGGTAPILNALAGGQAVAAPGDDPFDRVAYSNRPTTQDIKENGVSAEVNWDIGGLGGATLTSITASREWQAINGLDYDFSTADLIYRSANEDESFTGFETFSQELRLTGSTDSVDWMVGMFYSDEDLDRNDSYRFGAAYEGPPTCVHGGFVAAAFDEVLGLAQSLGGNPGMTGTLTVRYRKPTPLHTDLRFEATLDGQEGRKLFTSGRVYAGDTLNISGSAGSRRPAADMRKAASDSLTTSGSATASTSEASTAAGARLRTTRAPASSASRARYSTLTSGISSWTTTTAARRHTSPHPASSSGVTCRLAAGETMMEFSPSGVTMMMACPLAPSTVRSWLTSTPARVSEPRRSAPWESSPTQPTKAT